MLCFAKKSFENAFEPSNCAAAAFGPKHFKPAFSNSSTIPSTKGTSGPTMVRSIWFSWAKSTRGGRSSTARLMFSIPSSSAVPVLPGATNTFSTLSA